MTKAAAVAAVAAAAAAAAAAKHSGRVTVVYLFRVMDERRLSL